MSNPHDRPAVFASDHGAGLPDLRHGQQPLQPIGSGGGVGGHGHHDTIRLHLAQRVTYLEARCKTLESENDLLRRAMHVHADEAARMTTFLLAYKTWHDAGSPAYGSAHSELRRTFLEACAA